MSLTQAFPLPPIIFNQADWSDLETPHEDSIVISAKVQGVWVKRLLVDEGSSVNLITMDVFNALEDL